MAPCVLLNKKPPCNPVSLILYSELQLNKEYSQIWHLQLALTAVDMCPLSSKSHEWFHHSLLFLNMRRDELCELLVIQKCDFVANVQMCLHGNVNDKELLTFHEVSWIIWRTLKMYSSVPHHHWTHRHWQTQAFFSLLVKHFPLLVMEMVLLFDQIYRITLTQLEHCSAFSPLICQLFPHIIQLCLIGSQTSI